MGAWTGQERGVSARRWRQQCTLAGFTARVDYAFVADGTVAAIADCPVCQAFGEPHTLTAVSSGARSCTRLLARKLRAAHPEATASSGALPS